MIVVVMHAGLTIVPGDGGVVVFFCISGYIITTLLLRERSRTGWFDLRRFYLRRLIKLAPPLVAVVAIPTLVYAVFRPVDPVAVGTQLGFSYNWMKVFSYSASLDVLPGSEVVWSLAIEEQFYIGFALLWLLLLRVHRWKAWLTGIAAVAVVYSFLTRVVLAYGRPRESGWDDQRLQHLLRGTDARIEAIALGVLVALLADRITTGKSPAVASYLGRDRTLIGAVFLFLAASVFLRDWWGELAFRQSAQAVSAGLIILYGLLRSDSRLGMAFDTVARWPWVQTIGLSSYSIYLAHAPIMYLLLTHGGAIPRPLLILINIAVGTLAGVLVYRLVEGPVLRFKERRLI
jgi:peptidoglycan/LPS O-acetylase OafA/YrhL